jgi:hypothetical protein
VRVMGVIVVVGVVHRFPPSAGFLETAPVLIPAPFVIYIGTDFLSNAANRFPHAPLSFSL